LGDEAVDWTDAPSSPFRLRPLARAERQGYVQLLLDMPGTAPRRCIFPAMERTPLMVFPESCSGRLRLLSDEAAVEPAGLASRAASSLRAMTPLYGKAALRFGDLVVRPDGGRAATRAYRKLVKFARTSGFAFDGATFARHPELARGWPPCDRADEVAPGPKIAVALHLHYVELWPEIGGLLKRWRRPFILFVSLTRQDEETARRIRADFPTAEVEVVENRGRDVRPFLAWLESGRFDRFDLVCKIHGKRSLRDGAPPLFGELFRRATFLDLISSDARVRDICAAFEAAPDLGLIGPERFRARSRHGDAAEIMGQSRAAIEALCARMSAPAPGADYDVFHGTMFWARPLALAGLRDLGLARDFQPEAGLSDGALEHAVEGLINHAVRARGFRVAGTTAP
jgi:hypothetical protein